MLVWPAEKVCLIKVDGAIGPATASYISRAITRSATAHAQCLIVQLDTPGGLLESTKEIVQSFYASPVPTVVYVAPAGAGATSAGCFITLAADVAAMAPDTSIGAAHPVGLGGSPSNESSDKTMKEKLENFAASFIETIAEKRHRNVEWAQSAVRESASVTAAQALKLKVVEIIAADLPDLLRQLDGRSVQGRVLQTAGAELEPIPMLAREKVFQMLWRPEILFLLMLVAIYGIMGELSNPGTVVPGVLGAVALILALYMSAILPINIAGLALILLALGLFVAEAFVPAYGALTVGGILSFFLGALMLFDNLTPVFRLSLSLVIPATLLTAAFFLWVVTKGLRAQFLPVKVGREILIGKTAPALTPISEKAGQVFVEGEYWRAVSERPIEEGQTVEIIGVDGLTLRVRQKP